MGFSRILAEFAKKMWLAENPPEKNTASRKSAEKVGQPAEYNKKIRLVGLPMLGINVHIVVLVLLQVISLLLSAFDCNCLIDVGHMDSCCLLHFCYNLEFVHILKMLFIHVVFYLPLLHSYYTPHSV